MLMTLLQKQPELEVKNPKQGTATSEEVVANVQIKKLERSSKAGPSAWDTAAAAFDDDGAPF